MAHLDDSNPRQAPGGGQLIAHVLEERAALNHDPAPRQDLLGDVAEGRHGHEPLRQGLRKEGRGWSLNSL